MAPLSEGRIDPSTSCLQCSYHGWSFNADGTCAGIPQDAGGKAAANPRSTAGTLPVTVAQGLLYVWADMNSAEQARLTPPPITPGTPHPLPSTDPSLPSNEAEAGDPIPHFYWAQRWYPVSPVNDMDPTVPYPFQVRPLATSPLATSSRTCADVARALPTRRRSWAAKSCSGSVPRRGSGSVWRTGVRTAWLPYPRAESTPPPAVFSAATTGGASMRTARVAASHRMRGARLHPTPARQLALCQSLWHRVCFTCGQT